MADATSAGAGEQRPREPAESRAVRRASLLAERATARQRRSRRGVTVRQLPVARLPLLRRGRAAEPGQQQTGERPGTGG